VFTPDTYTVMHCVTTFWSITDRIYNSGSIRLHCCTTFRSRVCGDAGVSKPPLPVVLNSNPAF
uniref:Uncharacterized protein n=1 Tax=Paramormyrops kingsleyae TaxID=1676925 RepID=A0A3B3RA62_9TELE